MPEICAVHAPGLKDVGLLERFWIKIHGKILFANVICSLFWHETCWCVHVSVRCTAMSGYISGACSETILVI